MLRYFTQLCFDRLGVFNWHTIRRWGNHILGAPHGAPLLVLSYVTTVQNVLDSKKTAPLTVCLSAETTTSCCRWLSVETAVVFSPQHVNKWIMRQALAFTSLVMIKHHSDTLSPRYPLKQTSLSHHQMYITFPFTRTMVLDPMTQPTIFYDVAYPNT